MTINTLVKKNLFQISIILSFLIFSGFIHTKFIKPEIVLNKQSTALNINQDFLKLFSMGQNRLIADLYWISSLLESDLEHYKNKDLNSWLYLRFKSIIELDPKFLRAYQFGGKYLSIVKDDLFGAKDIFEKGIEVFPNDYDLLFNYGFLLAFELQDYKNAISIYKRVQHFSQAPIFIKSLIPKLQYETNNDLTIIYPIILNMYLSEPENSPLKNRFEKDLYAIKAEIDLNCLNSGQSHNCKTRDFNGLSYIKKGAHYVAPRDFKKYRLNKN